MRPVLLVPLVAISGVALATLPARYVSAIPDPWRAGEPVRLEITGPPAGAELMIVFGDQGAIAAPCPANGPCVTVVSPFRTVKATMPAGGTAAWTSPNPLPAAFAGSELCVQVVARVGNQFLSSMPWCEPVTVAGVWDSVDGAVVFVPDRPATWANAVAACASVELPLFVPRDPLADDALRGLADDRGWGPVWLGTDDRATEGLFRDPDGAPLAFTDWAPGAPDDPGGQDCVAQDALGQWDDVACAAVLPFVCGADARVGQLTFGAP